MQLHKRFDYRISTNSFRGNYSGKKLFKGGSYSRKYGMYKLYIFTSDEGPPDIVGGMSTFSTVDPFTPQVLMPG